MGLFSTKQLHEIRSNNAKKHMTGRFGSKSNCWKGGGVTKAGYHILSLSKKQRPLHRLIMELHIGRKLSSNEIVHHKDHDKLNNDICNLELVTRAEHAKLHKRPKRQNIIKEICSECNEYKTIGYIKHNLCRPCYKRLSRKGEIVINHYRRKTYGPL